MTTITTTVGRVSKAKRCSQATINIINDNIIRMRQLNHRLESCDDSKINNVNGTTHYRQQQTSQHDDRHNRRTKDVATNLITSYPSADNNLQYYSNGFILFLLLDEIDNSSYHAKIFYIFSISTMIFRAAHSPQSAVLIESNHWFHA